MSSTSTSPQAEPARVCVVGDFQPGNPTHDAVAQSIDHVGCAGTVATWIGTEALRGSDEDLLCGFDGFWVAPGSPYRSLEGALAAITYARTRKIPLLGTCGGFQHIVLEYARHVAGFTDAAHAEYDPYASTLFIAPLSCSLAGRTMEVRLAPGSRVAHAYGSERASEQYYCNFGLDPEHEPKLTAAGLAITGRDLDGEARVVELSEHPFFIGTLFVPQCSSALGAPHPLIKAFVTAVGQHPPRR